MPFAHADDVTPVSPDAIRIQMQIMQGLVTGMPLDDILELVLLGMSARLPDFAAAVWVTERHAQEYSLVFRAGLRVSLGQRARTANPIPDLTHAPGTIPESVLTQLGGFFGDPAAVDVDWVLIHSTKNQVVGVMGIEVHAARPLSAFELQVTRHYVQVAGFAVEKEQLDRENYRLAHYDDLTAIPNRRLFHERFVDGITQALESRRSLSLVLLDIDNFKHINDSYGHATGDRVLQAVARTIHSMLREVDTVARIGGDEFALILVDTPGQQALAFANRVLEAISDPPVLQSTSLPVRASAGVAECPLHGVSTDELLRCADTSLYAAKRSDQVRTVLCAH